MDFQRPYDVRPDVLSEPVPPHGEPELLRSLARLVRGLSALFWGMPIALVVCVQSATGNWLRSLGIMPAFLATLLLYYGLAQLGYFQRAERVWQRTLDRAKLISLLTIGLSPFLFWWNRVPDQPFFQSMVLVLALSGLLLLFAMNPVLRRLSAMLPDETLRQETRAFTSLNRLLLAAVPIFLCGIHLLTRFGFTPGPLSALHFIKDRLGLWLGLFLVLMPMAMTMALLWKTKEVILASVFNNDR